MTLSRKIVILLIAGITLYTIVGFLFNQYLILPSFIELEQEEARTDMRRCLEALDSQIDRIDLLCFDWAAWDDTYAFIREPYAGYFDSNLIPESFVDNGINLMYFFRTDGTVVWSAFYDLDEGVPVAFPDFEKRKWDPDDVLIAHSGRSSKTQGIVQTSRGPLLVASRPILPSEATPGETVRGTLVMGRILDDKLVRLLRERTQVAVDVIYTAHDALPPGAEDLRTGEIRIVETGASQLRVLAHIHDIHGADAVIFQALIPRTILARGKSAIGFNTLAAGLAGFIFLIMILFALKLVVTDPLERLSTHAKGVGLARSMAPLDIRERQDEIGTVAREFNNMIRRLRDEESELAAMRDAVARSRHLATIGEMGASVAHEIRNPLAGIKGALQILDCAGLSPDEREEATRALNELADRIERTVEQLLRFAKPIEPRRETFEIRDLIESVTAEPPPGARLSIACPKDATIHADPNLLRHVLENVWRNACQAMPPGGALEWKAWTDSGGAAIQLRNDGPRVPKDNIPRVFEPFFSTRVDGSGLGLAVSLRIIEAHHGTIALENAGEGGVLVTIRIPGDV